MSLAVFFVAMGASRLSTRVAPRLLIQARLPLRRRRRGAAGDDDLRPTFDSLRFAAAVLVVGIGLGLIASQVTNVNLASAGPAKTSETGALQGTAQNLGSALGTAIIGSLLLGILTTTFDHRVENDTSLPYAPRHQVAEKTADGLAFIPAEVAGGSLKQKGVPAPIVSQLESNYAQSQVDALKIAIGGVAADRPARPRRHPAAALEPAAGTARASHQRLSGPFRASPLPAPVAACSRPSATDRRRTAAPRGR